MLIDTKTQLSLLDNSYEAFGTIEEASALARFLVNYCETSFGVSLLISKKKNVTIGGPQLVRCLGPEKNVLYKIRTSTWTISTNANFTKKQFHKYEFYKISLKICPNGNHTNGNCISWGPPV